MNDDRGTVEASSGSGILTLPAAELPPELLSTLDAASAPAMLVALERLPDGRVAIQALPEIDPALVARLRKLMAEHADVLRRLS